MKRFWIEDIMWSWSKSRWTMTNRKVSRANLTFVILMLIQLVPSSCTVGKNCSPNILNTCDKNEVCVVADSKCECRQGFVENQETHECEKPKPKPPPEPSSSHLALGLGLSLTFFLVFVVAALVALHYKFGLFADIRNRLPRIRLPGGGEFNMVDNEDDDVNPIV